MATSTLVPLEQYLHTSYEPECEWVNGVLKEKSMPDECHGYFQTLLVELIKSHSNGQLRALTEVRIRVSGTAFRVPDILAIPRTAAFLPTLTVVPSICVEVLSPDEREKDLLEKIDDYVTLGVTTIWIVDPRGRAIATADATGIHPVDELFLEGTAVQITATEIFAELDTLEAL